MSQLSSTAETLETALAALGDLVVDSYSNANDVWIRVRPDGWRAAGFALRDRLEMDYFDFLSVLDWLPSPYGKGEDNPDDPPAVRSTEIKQGYTGGDSRFQVFARLMSSRRHIGVTLKADLDDFNPTIESWVPVYAGANWHEREAWEMFGVNFAGHPNQKHLYLPSEFEGFPLRKDFPLLARMVKPWPGIVDVEPIPAHLDSDGGGDES